MPGNVQRGLVLAPAIRKMVIFGNSYPKLADLKKEVTDKVNGLLGLERNYILPRFSRQVEKVFGEYTEIRLNREIKNGSFNTILETTNRSWLNYWPTEKLSD